MPRQDAADMQDLLSQRTHEADDHTRHQGARRHIIDRRDRSRHDQIPDCGAPCIMERAEATQRRIQREVQVAQDNPRQCVPPKDHHRVRMGSKPHKGLLLLPFLLPPDRGAQEEQDEGARGGGTQVAHRCVACAARRDRIRRFQPRLQRTRQQRVISDIPLMERLLSLWWTSVRLESRSGTPCTN